MPPASVLRNLQAWTEPYMQGFRACQDRLLIASTIEERQRRRRCPQQQQVEFGRGVALWRR